MKKQKAQAALINQQRLRCCYHPHRQNVVTTRKNFVGVECTGLEANYEATPSSSDDYDSLSEFINTLPPSVQRLLGNVCEQDIDPAKWIEQLKQGKVESAMVGLVKDGVGTYVVVLKCEDSNIRFQGPVDCHLDLIQSYRAELMGILSLSYFLWCITSMMKEDIPAQKAHIDNLLAVRVNNEKEVS